MEARGQTWFTSLERGGSFVRNSSSFIPFRFTQTPMAGRHNLENILLATTTARLLGVSDAIIDETVRHFAGVPHRLADVRMLEGVRYINDSTSTTPIAGQVALEAFEAPIVLVAGGNTKHLPLGEWPARIVERCRAVVLLAGNGTDELLVALEQELALQQKNNPVQGVFNDFHLAMDKAVSLTRPGDILLFSPGFTSFGMFLNEFDRGNVFVAYVNALPGLHEMP
jgi:UDP-N-acetylmuramoylalanine--D-glutamate ligase